MTWLGYFRFSLLPNLISFLWHQQLLLRTDLTILTKMATHRPQRIFTALLLLSCLNYLNPAFAAAETGKRFARSETLENYYLLSWEVDLEAKNITFEVKAQTTGYVGFGVNSIGSMGGADIVIGGVFDNGTSYFSDRHGVGNELPEVDKSQDWFLISAHEANGWTTIKFYRRFITCDREEDVQLTVDTIRVIYAVGAKDNIRYHQTKRGTKSLLLLGRPTPPVDVSAFERWDLPVHTAVPPVDTTYWNTIHKSPKFNAKSHMVAFRANIYPGAAEKYMHHMVFHRCRERAGMNLSQLLEPFVGHPGGTTEDPAILKIRGFCHTYLYAWAKGGSTIQNLPEHVGIPIGETGGQEYFLLEVHYDNPMLDKGVQFETGITVYYTDKLRSQDAGVLFTGTTVAQTPIIPPNVKEFVHVGHCSSECTAAKIPEEGINVVSVLLHSHLHGRKIRVRHFRQSSELPFLTNDENYDANYQQDRVLSPEVKILPGDHLSVECAYNSEWHDPPLAAYGGESNHHEMCIAYVMYYPLLKKLDQCTSTHISLASRLKPLGIDGINTKVSVEYPIITGPESLKGLNLMEALNTRVNWTSELKETMQYESRWAPQKGVCKSYRNPEEGIYKPTRYPNVTAYEPKFTCD